MITGQTSSELLAHFPHLGEGLRKASVFVGGMALLSTVAFGANAISEKFPESVTAVALNFSINFGLGYFAIRVGEALLEGDA